MYGTELYDWLAQAAEQDPEALQKMIEVGLFDDRMNIEGQTLNIGKGMWDTPMAQGQNVGGTYVAASPFEHLSTAMAKGLGGYFIGGSQKNQQELINRKGKGMEALIRAMGNGPRGRGGQQMPTQMPPQYGPGSAAAPWDPMTEDPRLRYLGGEEI
jgi:hypothetical protein